MESQSAVSVDAGVTMFQALESLGVTHVFGLPGTQTVPLFEALRRSRLATVVPTHERFQGRVLRTRWPAWPKRDSTRPR
jgi:Thiamine pyrophosphate enzyme, N-terminal TPP binding domain